MERLRTWINHPKHALLSGLLALALGGMLLYNIATPNPPAPANVSYATFIGELKQGKLSEVSLNPVDFSVKATRDIGGEITTATPGVYGSEEITRAAAQSQTELEVVMPQGSILADIVGFFVRLLPLLLIIGLVLWYVRRSSTPRSIQIVAADQTSDVSFANVAGVEEVITELEDVREFLKNPDRFRKLGAQIPKGVLLYGPPGTGKTLLARALAAEAGVPFYSVSGSDFVEMYAGLGAARMRKLFSEVRKAAPAILFIDEIDAIGRKRGGGSDGGARESDQTLNQLLVQMDGFAIQDTPVIVMAATNRLEMLDTALIRPGRFDRQVPIGAPDRDGRRAILETHAKNKPLGEDVDFDQLAVTTSGMTGADLANMLNEAALIAGRDGKDAITRDEIEQAMMRVIAGPAKTGSRMSDHERRVIAFHEAGHAIVGELLAGNHDVQKVSIVPRGQSGGQTIATPQEDRKLLSEEQLQHRIALLMAGRCAEEIAIGEITSGAGHDLEVATELAMAAVNKLGFSRRAGLRVETPGAPLPAGLAEIREQEIEQILSGGHTQAHTFLTEQRALLDALAELLLERETIDRIEFLDLVEQYRTPAPALAA